MKLLFFTDSHIRGTTPRSRKDNFYETLKQKFHEIIQLSYENRVDYILHGGDWFDRPDISPAIVREFALIIKDFPCPIYTVAGNHDLFGYNPGTLGRTMLGLLEGVGIVNILHTGDKVLLEKNKFKVQLCGSSYHHDIDTESYKTYYLIKKDRDVQYAINIVHGMLLHKPFMEEIRFTLLEEIFGTEADVTLSGHYHSGFGIKKIGEKYFINPGSIVRTASSLSEISRMPSVVILEIENSITVKEIVLKSARPGEEVLDRPELEDSQKRKYKLQEFYNTIQKDNGYQSVDLSRVIEIIGGSRELTDEVKQEAIRRIAAARESLSTGCEES